MIEPQVTPGSNGYLSALPAVNYGDNPWAAKPGETAGIMDSITQGASGIQKMQQQATDYSNQSSAYPTFQNSMGVGSQNAYAQAQPQTGGSTGFNPWSLQGEALSR